MHTFSVDLGLDSSDSIEDNCSFSSIDDEYESGQDNSSNEQTDSYLTHAVEKSLHIFLCLI